ncbi:unnamed protein product [Thelazia callipaeda]|uniref:non-specific serine/threonine protein kinase n=1 Tax=Thelazia callipaeda TaxID=103827 RepID=A0A0N5D278_THECL|nr:unnamed protein product [Thelazia callipaeda]
MKPEHNSTMKARNQKLEAKKKLSYADIVSRKEKRSCDLPAVINRWEAAVSNWEYERKVHSKIGLLINQRYEVLLKINFGTFGSIYSATDTFTGKKVALKFVTRLIEHKNFQLRHEYGVYNVLKNIFGFPKVYWFGTEFDHEILVMQLLGPSLAQLYKYCDYSFTSETITEIGQQMLDRLRILHLNGYIHCDVKPHNFLMGINDDEETCYLVDYGLARCYRSNDEIRSHISLEGGRRSVGTVKYASINNHEGCTLSRRDDLESLGYVLIEFINRTLPWSMQKSNALKRKFRSRKLSVNKIKAMKKETDWGLTCPRMAKWMNYCFQLGFEDDVRN